MIIDEIFRTNILVLLICLIGFILEIKKGLEDKQILKKIEVNKLKKKIEILKNQRFQIDRLIIKRKNNKILWYFRTKLLKKIDRNEKNLEEYNIILKMFNKMNINKNNYKKIFRVAFSAPPIITISYTFFSIVISYILVLIRYIVLYHQLPSNIINIVDILNIMYRDVSYLLFFFIFSIIISYLLFVLEKKFLKITENNNIEELNYPMYFDKEKINSSFIILLFWILIIYNIFRILIFKNTIILPQLSLFMLSVYSFKNIYYKSIGLMKFFILLPFFFIFTIISIPERYYKVFFKENYNTINGILVSDTKERIKLIEAVYPNLNIVEIEKKGIMNIIERNDIKIELLPFCKNSQKNICMDIKKYEIDKTKTIDMTLNATEELKQFKFNSNDKFKVRIYNFRTRSFNNLNIKEIKYLKEKGNEKNIIYFEKEDFHLSIELKKSYDYKNWGIVDIEKLN